MRNWIAGVITLLGSLLVLSGLAVLVIRALNTGGVDAAAPRTADVPTGDEVTVPGRGPGATARLRDAARRIQPAYTLIAWGAALLVLAAIAAGAISFSFGANAGTK